LIRCPDAEDWLTLTSLPGLGCTLIKRLLEQTGCPGDLLRRGKLAATVPGVGPRLASMLADAGQVAAARQKARRELERLGQSDASLLSLGSPEYPELLRNLPDPPTLLYGRGDLDALHQPAVAVIGSRAATDYGRRVASDLAGQLSAMGLVVVSGAAYGIDCAAHHGALRAGGRTVAVLGCGVDVVYPRTHSDLLRKIAGQGLLLSEYPLGTPPEGFRFPARNRIISGLVKGVVVVEATEKSGSLITARLALDQGREVFAVPGRIDSPKSAGAHRLIQQGAHLVQTVDDIIEGLAWAGCTGPSMPSAESVDGRRDGVSAAARRLLDCLDVYPRDIDALARITELPATELPALLLQLELQGLVRQLPGQLYELRSAE
jgi:DNA processing protein